MTNKKELAFPTIAKLIESKKGSIRIYSRTIQKSVDELMVKLRERKMKGRFLLELLDDDEDGQFDLSLSEGLNMAGKPTSEKVPHVSLKTSRRTWIEITTGRLSPAEAVLTGQMDVSGDLGLAKRIYAVAARENEEEINF